MIFKALSLCRVNMNLARLNDPKNLPIIYFASFCYLLSALRSSPEKVNSFALENQGSPVMVVFDGGMKKTSLNHIFNVPQTLYGYHLQ